jgi:prepilin-type N-terminal cleavage/methylation domain-containing protein
MNYNFMKRGFTLTELLITIVIVGVLTTLAVTQYGGVRERALAREAIANLKLIAAAERIYDMEEGFFYPTSGSETDAAAINTFLKLSINERNWDYAVSGSAGGFTATSDRAVSGCQYTISNGQDEPTPTNAKCPP